MIDYTPTQYTQTQVDCPKHGKHTYTISSTIPGHKGSWCQLCWLESLGDSLPAEQVPMAIVLADNENIPPDSLT
jgi:hypothetical protein